MDIVQTNSGMDGQLSFANMELATSQPLAAQGGLQILRDGGNAIDAAVATAAMLNVGRAREFV